jgi:hypothetical protein
MFVNSESLAYDDLKSIFEEKELQLLEGINNNNKSLIKQINNLKGE